MPRRKTIELAAKAAWLLDDLTSRIVSGVLIAALVFTVWMLSDMSSFNAHGAEQPKSRDLAELIRENPDTRAWLTIENTKIDYPVVQGRDNFEYLDLDFSGNFYVGGTLFLDCENAADFSDSYNIIHGHHMAEGIMFGDLDKFLNEDFFNDNREGTLKTPYGDYGLEIFGVGTAYAYDTGIYSTEADMETHKKAVNEATVYLRGTKEPVNKILVLSTCTDKMDDNRTVLFCRMYEVPDGD